MTFEAATIYPIAIAAVGAISLILEAIRVAFPKTRKILPLGKTSFNQTAVLMFLFVGSGSLLLLLLGSF